MEFTTVNIEEFIDPNELNGDDESTKIIVLTSQERALVNMFFDRLKTVSPSLLEGIVTRFSDLERLASAIAHYPSLFQQQRSADGIRNQETLVEALLEERSGDRMLYLPTKAVLGKGFLVAKFQAFSLMAKISQNAEFSQKERDMLKQTSLTLMFTIMVEDVYLSLLEDTTIPVDIRQQIASALIILWEHRSDQNAADMSPVLNAIWTVRNKLTPAFGTMVGTSELLMLTIEMDDQWREFMMSKLSDADVSKALEEFLFGLSFEQINKVKAKISDGSCGGSLGQKEVYALLGKRESSDAGVDPREFYMQYTIRRDNARARRRLNLEGPHKTLEDHFMRFILEKNREKQYNDRHAK